MDGFEMILTRGAGLPTWGPGTGSLSALLLKFAAGYQVSNYIAILDGLCR